MYNAFHRLNRNPKLLVSTVIRAEDWVDQFYAKKTDERWALRLCAWMAHYAPLVGRHYMTASCVK